MHAIVIDTEKCIGCGLCVSDCRRRVLELRDGRAHLLPEPCLMCGHCVAICPQNAVSMDGCEPGEVLEYNRDTFHLNPDHLLNAIKFRRSVRQFKPQPVSREDLTRIIEAGRYTPTGSNSQTVRYTVVLDNIDKLEQMALDVFRAEVKPGGKLERLVGYYPPESLKPGFFFFGAPALILVSSAKDFVDPALASTSMELMAQSMGIGAFFVGLFCYAVAVSEELRTALGLDSRQKPATCLALGHPAVSYRRTVPRNPAQITWM